MHCSQKQHQNLGDGARSLYELAYGALPIRKKKAPAAGSLKKQIEGALRAAQTGRVASATRPGTTLVSGTFPQPLGAPWKPLGRGLPGDTPAVTHRQPLGMGLPGAFYCFALLPMVSVGFEPWQPGSQVPSQTAGLTGFASLLSFFPLLLPLSCLLWVCLALWPASSCCPHAPSAAGLVLLA